MVLRELDDTSLTLGKTQLSLLSLIEGSVAAGLVLVVVLWLASLLELHVIERWVDDLSMRKVAMNIARAGTSGVRISHPGTRCCSVRRRAACPPRR